MTKDELLRENERLRDLLMEIRDMIDAQLSDEDDIDEEDDDEEDEDDDDYDYD